MDEFGECITQALQRQHDEKKAKKIEALESTNPDDFFTLMQGGWTRPGRRKTPRFKTMSLVPTEAAD